MPDPHEPNLSPALRFANEIQPEPLLWLWPGRIPLGNLTLLIGDPGVGKSLLAADLAARVSTGRPWPDATQNSQLVTRNYPAGVLLVSPEDRPADTLLPRLAAAGADLSLICILDGVTRIFRTYLSRYPGLDDSPAPTDPVPLRLPEHLDLLAEAVRAVTVPRLLVLDPLPALMSPGAQASSEGLGALLAGLADIARSYSVAIVAVGHLVKTRSYRLLYRVRGSLAFVAAARCVHLLAADPQRPDRRVLCPLKTVYGPPPPPIAFRIALSRLPAADPGHPSACPPTVEPPYPPASVPPAPRLEWETASPAGAPDLPTDLFDLSADMHSALSDACEWLADCLAAGPRAVGDIIRDARAAGLSVGTLRRAKRSLGVRSLKPAKDAPWHWSRAPATSG
jgi:hypothetical protein